MTYASPSADPRARAIWERFAREGAVSSHFSRAAGRFSGGPCWSLILPIADGRVVARAEVLQRDMDSAHGAEAIPADRLHLTIETLAIEPPAGWIESLSESLAGEPPISVMVGGANAFPECAMLEVLNPEPLRGLRGRLQEKHSWLRGDVPAERYLPHVSIAYFGRAEPAPDIVATLGRARALPPIEVTVNELRASRLEFDTQGRSRRLESHSLPLRGAA